MKKIGVLLVTVALAATLTACGKQPTAEMDAARVAIDAAVAEGAEKFTASDLQAVKAQMDAALAEVKTQDGKIFKSYKKAQEALAKVKADAEALKAKTVTVKEEKKQEAITALADANTSVTEAKGLLANAPVGKGSRADIEMMKADVAGLETALTEVQPLIDGGDYIVAAEKANAIKSKAASVSEEIKVAQEKAAVAKKK
jgi:major membrane immunogen (membrane-anchored lipoprotein)